MIIGQKFKFAAIFKDSKLSYIYTAHTKVFKVSNREDKVRSSQQLESCFFMILNDNSLLIENYFFADETNTCYYPFAGNYHSSR